MAKSRKTRKDVNQTRREIWGVVFIALAVFLGICIYSGAIGIVGAAITSVAFGLTGLFAYAIPAVLLLGGILFIAYAGSKPQRGRTVLILVGIVLFVSLLHVIARPIASDAIFPDYIKDAYVLGEVDQRGGGAIGSLLSYPLLMLTGKAGAYIFLIAGVVIIILLVTRLSIREAGQRVGTQVAAGISHAGEIIASRRQPLYMEDLIEEEEEAPPPPKPARRKKTAPLVTMPLSRPKRGKRAAFLADEEDGPQFFPSAGPLKRRPKDALFFEDDDYLEPPPARQPKGSSSAGTQPEPEIIYYDEATGEIDPALNTSTIREAKEMARQQQDMGAPSFLTLEAPTPKATRQSTPAGPDVPPFEFQPTSSTGQSTGGQPPVEQPVPPREPVPYVPPPVTLLNPARVSNIRSGESPAEVGRLLVETLANFNVAARVVNISVGPVITRYELAPAPGVRVNKITALSDDIALALAAPRVRIEAPIPGKSAVGVEVPNKDSAPVVLRDTIDTKEFRMAKSPLALAIGKDIAGKVIVSDLAKMPHLLIAGATGSGKSVSINGIILSLVFKCTPEELQLILVDPKVVELSSFGTLPHLKVPVVTDPKRAAGALAAGVREMTERYKAFAQIGARDLERYNDLMENKLPKLVIIIDELADLMMVAPDTVEDSICRIAQLGRAAGIHLIVATQRPSADVITGLIKANIPSRIAFAVSSAIDSRIILDTGGAEKLLGRGDMLFHANGSGKPIRAQGAFVSDEEVERVMRHFQQQAMEPSFDEQLIAEMETGDGKGGGAQGNGKQEDDLLGEAVRIVLDSGQASISMIQRRLRVGYARAARLVDIMEQHKFVSGFDGSKARRVLITRAQFEQIFTEEATSSSTIVKEAPDGALLEDSIDGI